MVDIMHLGAICVQQHGAGQTSHLVKKKTVSKSIWAIPQWLVAADWRRIRKDGRAVVGEHV